MQQRTGTGVLLVLGSCFSLQFGAAMASRLFPLVGPWGVTTLRLCLAGLLMVLIVRPRVRSWSRPQWRAVLAFAFAMAGMNGFFYLSIDLIPVAVAVTLEFLGPLVLAAVLSRRPRDAAWVLLAFLGMGLLAWESITGTTALDPLGCVYALISGAFWALYVITSARVGQAVPGRAGLAAALVLGGLMLAVVGGRDAAVGVALHPEVLWMALVTALLASVIPYTMEFSALKILPSAVFSILLSLEPAVAALVGWLLLGQPSGPVRLAAIALVIAASAGTTLSAHREGLRTDPV